MRVDSMRRCSAVAAAIGGVIVSALATAQSTTPTPPSAPPSTAASTQPTSVVPAEPTTPRGALKALVGALQMGDKEKIKSLVAATNPTEEKMVDAMASQSAAERKFFVAAQTAYGADAKDLTGDTAARAAEGMAQIDGSKETINGDHATVDNPAPGPNGRPSQPISLEKSNGTWHIPIGELAHDVDPRSVDARVSDMAFITQLMNESADDVAAGKYKTAHEAGDAIKSKLMIAMMKRANAATSPSTMPGGGAPLGAPTSPSTAPAGMP